ncbi:MAG: tetratricopeptide repeat protein [Myxococcota bacterium]
MWWMVATAVAATSPDQAAAALEAKDYDTAAKAYRKLAKERPEDGEMWFQLGAAEHGLSRWKQAAAAWGRAREIGYRPAVAAYDQACALARLGRTDEALDALEAALQKGPFDERVRQDADLASLAGNARFEALLHDAELRSHPCRAERYAALDFWVGDWQVAEPSGRVVGHNVVTREQDGCVVVEHWTDALGNTGQSYTLWDPGRGKWRQLWVEQHGHVVEYEGDFVDGALVMTGRTASPDGTEVAGRGTWSPLPGGGVRQLLERQDEAGAWQVGFDGRYTPSEAPAQ